MTLVANAPISLPTRIVPGPTGAARIRRSVPWRRSSNTLSSPDWAEKNRNRIAIEALKNVARSGTRSSVVTSTTATGGAAVRAASAIRCWSAGDGDEPASAATVETASWVPATPSPNRAATAFATSVASPLVRDPTTASVVG